MSLHLVEAYHSPRRLKPLRKSVNDVLEEFEDETRFIMVDGKPVTIKAVIDRILNEDNVEKKRKLGKG